MYVKRPSRFMIEWDSLRLWSRLKGIAVEDGTFSEEHSDWFDPADIQECIDAGDDLNAARRDAFEIAVTQSKYGRATVLERVGIHQSDGFWDEESVREVETIEAPA